MPASPPRVLGVVLTACLFLRAGATNAEGPAPDKPANGQPGSEKTASEKLGTEKPGPQKPGADKPGSGAPAPEKPAAAKPGGDPVNPPVPEKAGTGSAPAEPASSSGVTPATLRPGPPAPKQGSPPSGDDLAKARVHFDTALERYSRGQYRGAIAELERARELDPQGKDLVYNLALVHEKLGELAISLGYFRLYRGMETDEDERARAEASILRLEGALAELPDEARPAPVAAAPRQDSTPASRSAPPVRAVDEWVWATGALAVVAGLLGVTLGVRALLLEPGPEDATGGSRSAQDFRHDAHAAHQSAVAADIAFAVALTSGLGAGFLYFERAGSPVAAQATPAPGALQARGTRVTPDLMLHAGVTF